MVNEDIIIDDILGKWFTIIPKEQEFWSNYGRGAVMQVIELPEYNGPYARSCRVDWYMADGTKMHQFPQSWDLHASPRLMEVPQPWFKGSYVPVDEGL